MGNAKGASFDASAEYMAAMKMLELSKTPGENAEAVKRIKRAAEAGHSPAKYTLHLCYAAGHGIEPDLRKSLDWLESAAEEGHVPSQIKIVDIWSYMGPYFVCFDSEAKLEEAERRREPLAIFVRAMCKYYGTNTDRDIEGGEEMLDEAAELGSQPAELAIRMHEYMDGPGRVADAIVLLMEAASLDNTAAIYFVMRLPMSGMTWKEFLDSSKVDKVVKKELAVGTKWAILASQLMAKR